MLHQLPLLKMSHYFPDVDPKSIAPEAVSLLIDALVLARETVIDCRPGSYTHSEVNHALETALGFMPGRIHGDGKPIERQHKRLVPE